MKVVLFVTRVQQSQSLISFHIFPLFLDVIYVCNKLSPREVGKEKDKNWSYSVLCIWVQNSRRMNNSENPALTVLRKNAKIRHLSRICPEILAYYERKYTYRSRDLTSKTKPDAHC